MLWLFTSIGISAGFTLTKLAEIIVEKTAKKFYDFLFSTDGKLLNYKENLKLEHRFFLQGITTEELDMESDVGYMIRTVAGEAGGSGENGKRISYKAKIGVAEVIKRRAEDETPNSAKYDWNRTFSDKNTYKDVVLKTGFDAVKKALFKNPKILINQTNGLEQFLDCISACLYVHYVGSNITDNAYYFFTPGKKNNNPPVFMQKMIHVCPIGINKQYEFTFYKFNE